jgi:hypothetical protein
MNNRQVDAIHKRARRAAARTGRPVEVLLEEITAAEEGRARGEAFRRAELHEEWMARDFDWMGWQAR